MPDPNMREAMKAISEFIRKNESIPEDIRTDFAIADLMRQASDKIFAISREVSCDHRTPLAIKKAWLSNLQFVLAGAEGFAAEHGIVTEEEEP